MVMKLCLFGAPTLYEDGTPITLGRRKAMALLAYLAVTATRHHRETLATLLWPESEASAAFSALRNVLWILRQSPLGPLLRSDRSTVELVEDPSLEIDVKQFRDLTHGCPNPAHGPGSVCEACVAQRTDAVKLWRGPFLDGFTVTNSVQFDDWQFAEGESLKRELGETLSQLIEFHSAVREWSLVESNARRWLQTDTLNELGYRYLMRALHAQGKRSEAIQCYQQCVATLDAELGLSPEAETVQLADELRAAQSSVSAVDTIRTSRLPHSIVPLIGREEISERLEGLLTDPSVRLVTLTGLGGSGKTSLALHVARRIERDLADGAALVALDDVAGEGVAAAVARSLGVTALRDQHTSVSEQLLDFLSTREMVLILDGVERVLPQVSSLLPTLRAAPRVTILVTSRVALRMEGETTIPLHGLDYPSADTPLEQVLECPAVRLLRIISQRHGNPLESGTAELAGMARLARILEGSPLGLEMAAGWRTVLTWDEIADRISGNLEFLVHTREDVAPRHQTFAAIFEQAWSMLPSHARKTLRGLSVFRHSFTVKAAEEIVGGSPASLALLVNRCLVRRAGVDRYEIHELLRQFASGKLRAERAEAERVRDRHAAYYLNRVEEWFEKLTGPEQYPTLERMSIDMGNIHTALQRAAEAGESGLLGRAVEGLFFYYDMRTQFEEADRLFRAVHNAYVQHPKHDTVLEGFLQIAYGWTGMRIQPDEATRDLQAGLELLPESAPTTRLHAIANVICAYASRSEEAATHLKRIQESVEFYQNCGDAWGEGLARAAWSELERGHDEAMAETLAYESLRLHREAGDAWGEGLVLMSLGRMAENQGHFELALTRYEQSQCLSEPIGADISGVINSIASQARVVGRLGQGARSEQLAAEALRLSRGVGNRLLQARASIELARARAKRGDRASSRELLEEAFRLSTYREWDYIQAECARMLLEMALDEGDVGLAERWLREADELEPNHAEMPALQERFEALRRSSS